MSSPLVKLQELRNTVKNMHPEDKRKYHRAKKAVQEAFDGHGKLAELAALELQLASALKRGDK